jgi:site-specific DNA-methyltransferase (adenine-specific)/adenine-specific DNA-methyltransferase
MSILSKLPDIADGARETWEHGVIPADLLFDAVMDSYDGVLPDAGIGSGQIITGDNLRVGKTLLAAVRAGVQDAPALIYMDPPFFTNSKYCQELRIQTARHGEVRLPVSAFDDTWSGGGTLRDGGALERYLRMLSARVSAARDLLSPEGSLWIHLDHHAAHYMKVIADDIFGGPEYLMNEVVWRYGSGGATKRRFARKHDTLLFYAKDPERHRFHPLQEKSYNRGRKPYRFKGVKEYSDEGGWYTLVNMRDVWSVDMVGRTSSERTGYATQKPEALLERIVSSCTEAGALCVDMFGGSGTLAAVCAKSGRRWVTIDSSPLASLHASRRMTALGAAFEVIDGTSTVADEPGDEAAGQGVGSWELSFARAGGPGEPGASAPGRRGGDSSEDSDDSDDSGGDSDGSDDSGDLWVSPASYRMPETGLGVSAGDAAELIETARRAPERFMAGMSAEIRGAGDDGPFRPGCVSYGGSGLRLPAGALTPDARIMIRVEDIFGGAETLVASPDAGMPGASPDAGTPDADTPDADTPDAEMPGASLDADTPEESHDPEGDRAT